MNADKNRTLESFAKALGKLELFLATPITEERDKAGIIQAFEYSFAHVFIPCVVELSGFY